MTNDEIAILKIRESALVQALAEADQALRRARENRDRLNRDLGTVRGTLLRHAPARPELATTWRTP